jgi:dihydrodipicolinate synthase/N-acetylneuraminate lyase
MAPGAVLTAMITPFGRTTADRLELTARLAQWLVSQGNNGLVVEGTRARAPRSVAEQTMLFQVVRGRVGSSSPGRLNNTAGRLSSRLR